MSTSLKTKQCKHLESTPPLMTGSTVNPKCYSNWGQVRVTSPIRLFSVWTFRVLHLETLQVIGMVRRCWALRFICWKNGCYKKKKLNKTQQPAVSFCECEGSCDEVSLTVTVNRETETWHRFPKISWKRWFELLIGPLWSQWYLLYHFSHRCSLLLYLTYITAEYFNLYYFSSFK